MLLGVLLCVLFLSLAFDFSWLLPLGLTAAFELHVRNKLPGFRFRVIDEQNRVRRHILLFVGEDRQEDLDAPIPAGRAVTIVGALSGG